MSNELGEVQRFHLSHMVWKQPSEHIIDKRVFSAELQVFHVQYATSTQVALSFLFDKELSLRESSERLKTCFVDSFDFFEYDASVVRGVTRDKRAPILDIPLKEFINFLNTDKMIYYYGSETVPPCQETVTWIINLSPHVITQM